MKIDELIEKFAEEAVTKPYKDICDDILIKDITKGTTKGGDYSFKSQPGYNESEYLQENIRESVKKYNRDKDKVIALYKSFVDFLKKAGVDVNVNFPPISVSSPLDRQLFIAKYLQEDGAKVEDLENILWVGRRTIESDISSLRGGIDPIIVNGKQFKIPDMERSKGTVRFASTAHPLFLTQNLTQVMVMLKGLKKMSEDPLYRQYALETAADIWSQLSDYAKRRIRLVLTEMIPDDIDWYEELPNVKRDSFLTEKACSNVQNEGMGILIECLKNRKTCCIEYDEDGKQVFYRDCLITKINEGIITVVNNSEVKELVSNRIIRNAYTPEELSAN